MAVFHSHSEDPWDAFLDSLAVDVFKKPGLEQKLRVFGFEGFTLYGNHLIVDLKVFGLVNVPKGSGSYFLDNFEILEDHRAHTDDVVCPLRVR